MSARIIFAGVGAAVLCMTTAARAQSGNDPDGDGIPSGSAAPAAETPAAERPLEDQQALAEEEGVQPVRDPSDPWEDPHGTYYFGGALYRQIVVPTFLTNLFAEDSVTVSDPGFGLELTYRKYGFDIVGSLWWQGLGFDGPFRASGDPEEDAEWMQSDLSAVFASAAFLWSTPFDDVFSLEYGLDVGLGVLFGDLVRTEAYRDGSGWQRCNGAGSPDARFCGPTISRGPTDGDGDEGEHYNVVARKWSDGGSVPNVVPWIAVPHLGLRIKPVRQFMVRIDAGFGLGLFFGLSAAYGV